MLTQAQLERLNMAIRHNCKTENPLVRLIKAAEQSSVSFQDVLEHLILQTLQNADQTESPTVTCQPPIGP